VRRRLGLPVVGSVPRLAPADRAVRQATLGGVLDPLLCTVYSPRSMAAEAYRGVRTALYFNTRGEGRQVIQVTSPASGDGKSTTAANLAVSIAQSGKRVLLVDADMRKPRQHKIFGLRSETGLSLLVLGEVDVEAAVQASGVPNLSVLAAGPLPPNPAELLTSPRFKEALDQFRGIYDFVIVDTPPLLAVTDPSVVAPRVDSVLLTIRMTKNARTEAERARQVLIGLGATILGVVVNGVDHRAGGSAYGYGRYGYGYGYGEAETDPPEPLLGTAPVAEMDRNGDSHAIGGRVS
jgi:succinoglycan biosynthesis transport protein ExoP